MIDYQQGKIYTIRCKTDPNLIYVGSTVAGLHQRWYNHKHDSSRRNSKINKTMKELGIENFYIELYELYPCNSKNELEKREGEIIRLIGTLNEKIAGRDKYEYYKDNMDTLKEKFKEYYTENRDKVREKQNQYALQNKENKKEYDKEYREKNKEKIKERKKVKMICECGCEITKDHLAQHLRTDKHKLLLSLINLE